MDEHNRNDNKANIQNSQHHYKSNSQDDTNGQSVAPVKRRAALGMGAILSVAGITLAAQHAHAISALDVVNTITFSGGVGVSRDLMYGDSALQDLDVYYPKPLTQAINNAQPVTTRYPMVVFVHGGSWESGNKEGYAFVGQSLARAGYVTAVINYRKAPEHVYPDFVNDTARAIAWSYHNAERLHADPQRFAVMGHSAGAFNAVAAVSDSDFLAPFDMTPDDISAVIGMAGPYSYDFRQYSGGSAFGDDATPDEVMPDRHIKGVQPPYLLLTAENDSTVHDQNTIKMTAALRQHGATVDNGVITGVSASHATSIGAMAPPLGFLNDSREQVLRYLNTKLNQNRR